MAEENKIDTEEVREETPVLEETNENVSDSESNPEIDADTDGDKEMEFNPTAFSDVPVKVADDTEATADGDDKDEEKGEKKDGELDGDEAKDALDWASYDDDDIQEKPVSEDVVENVKEEVQASTDKDAFKQVSEELGLRFDDIEEFKNHLIELEAENDKLRTNSSGVATNSAIQELEELRSKGNEDLVRLSLEKEGFKGDDLEDAVDKYIDNGMLEIEARKIRNTIDNAIGAEQKKVTQSTLDSDATQQKEHEDNVRALESHIKETKTMFGFQMAKDEESLAKVHKGHIKYITSGKFADEVFKDSESISKAAWLWKNQETIMNAIANKNLQKGKEAILNDIREPEVVEAQRFKGPKDSDGFDAKAFTYGNT